MEFMRISAILVLVVLILSATSCKKNADTTVGGKTGVATMMVIPAWSVRGGYFYVDDGGKVYVKYNTTTSPGTNTNLYDDSVVVYSKINQILQAECTFQDLSNGNYYFYFKGTINKMPVSGGEYYPINRQTGHSIILPVVP